MDTQLPDALITTLSTLLGSEGWRLDAISRRQYSEDDSQCFSCADAVALPRDLNEVVAIVRACRQHRVPVIPRGTGTGTVGGAVPLHGGIVLSLARMNRIVALLPDDRCAVVQPGVINNHLQQALAPHGLFWPPDPSSTAMCSIGGNLATNAGGPRCGEVRCHTR